MSNTEFKKAFDSVEPDTCMEIRLLEKIKTSKKKKFPLKPVLCGALALAVFVGCIGGIHYKTTYTDRPFSVIVVSASDEITNSAVIGDKDISLPNLTVESNVESSGDTGVYTDNNAGFAVSGDDIDYIQYKSENGYFFYADELKMIRDKLNGDYYAAVIPVSDTDAKNINFLLKNSNADTVFDDYVSSHNVSEYFSGISTDMNNYQVEFLKCSDEIGCDDKEGYAFFLTDLSRVMDYYSGTGIVANGAETLTVDRYDIPQDMLEKYYTEDEILMMTSVGYQPQAAVDALLDDPDMDKSKLPSDEITITVTFKDGKKAKKVITVSYDSDGTAHFAYK